MESPRSVAVPRREFDATEPWNIPEGCPPVMFARATDGTPPRLATLTHLFHDGERLYVLFTGVDAGIVATRYGRDEPLWEEDVLELFIAPSDPLSYFEIEVSPIGTLFDARIHSPDGKRSTMDVDPSWDCAALAAIRRVRRTMDALWRFETLLAMPFADFGVAPPAPGEKWRGNLFRIDRDPENGDEYTAWCPTMATPPDFHLPGAFGDLEF